MSETDCIFCKIVAGAIPSVKLYEDDHVLSFMDIGPVIKGHALVIPKAHYNPLMETPVDVLGQLIAVVRRVARAQMIGLEADGINVTQANGACAGQVVPHIHFHVIPRFNRDGHHWNWDAKRYDSHEEMRTYADRILAGLNHARNAPCATT
jgi:histidine triad (HIT) family protein